MSASNSSLTDSPRDDELRAFIEAAGWGDAAVRPLAGDASTRRYLRLSRNDATAVVMDAPPAAETSPCPPDADIGERMRLGYNARARLAGPNLAAFVCLAETLRARGLSAPDIYAADLRAGIALIEDLGDSLYARAIPEGADEQELYGTAIDALAELHTATAPPLLKSAAGGAHHLLDYDRVALTAEIELLPDWYWPRIHGAPAGAADQATFVDAWAKAIAILEAQPKTLTLRDFHAENLIWLPARKGAARVGLLDFQDAVRGHPAYDLVSLLEDARRDVASQLADKMLTRYCEAAKRNNSAFDEDAFRTAYAVLGAQRNVKIVGIFARLADRDGKTAYLKHLSRVWAHLRHDLQHPSLVDVRGWMDTHFPNDMSNS